MNTNRLDCLIVFFRTLDRIISRISTLIWIVVLLLASYAMYDAYIVYNQASDKSVLKYKPVLNNGEENTENTVIPNSIAWLTLNETNVDYPIMQGIDNNEYLNKDPFGNFSLGGSIFLDYRNSSDFSDSYNLIYGHHMEHGTMFGALDEFKNEKYFRDHKNGELIVGTKKYDLRIFAVMNCVVTDDIIFDPTKGGNIAGFIEENALYIDKEISLSNETNMIALTTCAASPSEARLAVFCIVRK